MKKVLLLIALSFMLGSCTNASDNPMADSKTPMDTSTPKYQKELDTVSGKISSSKEFKSCMDMNVPMCIQSAGMQIAQKERSVEFCNELPEAAQKESCIFAVTMIDAQEKNDISLCDSIEGEYGKQCKISMIRTDAMTKKDPKICESMPIASETQNDTIQDECKLNVLMNDSTNTKESCDIIANDQIKEMCINMVSSRPLAPEVPTVSEAPTAAE